MRELWLSQDLETQTSLSLQDKGRICGLPTLTPQVRELELKPREEEVPIVRVTVQAVT